MSGNASRYSHQRDRRYSQVILSQSAMVTDADQREGMAVALRNTTTLGGTSIRTGVPQTGGAVVWEEAPDPSAHKIMTGLRPGKVVADGHVGEVRVPAGASLTDPGIDLLWQQHDLADAPELTDLDGPYAVFADLWHRFAGPAEDPRLADPAFLSAETATRTELMAQLKAGLLESGPPDDAELVERIQDGLPIYGDFRLTTVALTSEIVEPDACDPCATTLEDPNQDAGNSLFRLEVHESGFNRPAIANALPLPQVPCLSPGDGRVVLKWSHDNGSVEVPAAQASALIDDSKFDTAVFELTTPAAEQRLGLYTEGMTDRLSTLHARADIEAALAGAPADAILRVWDGAVSIDTAVADLDVQPVGTLSAEGTITTGGSWTLEIELGGLALTLEAAPAGDAPYVLPGDAWCVEVREYATGTGDTLIWEPEPVEVEHHYAFLGVIESAGFRNEAQPEMRSRAFPALTELDALDIHYDNALSGAEAWTVQGALDLLFATPPGDADCECQCSFTVDPEQSLTAQLSEIAERIREEEIARALICFPAGHFMLEQPVAFKAGTAITLRGAGRDLSVIEVAEAFENNGLISFFGVATVAIEELSVVGVMKVAGEAPVWVFGFHDVADVSMWRVSVRVARSEDGLAQGIRVMSDRGEDVAASVSLRECVFRLGPGGQGVGIWRAAESLHVEDCEFRSTDVESLGGSRKLGVSNDFVANTGAARRTPERERQIGDGFFMDYPGSSEMLLDFTGLPPEVRGAAARYWALTLRMLEGGGAIAEPGDFEAVKAGMSTLNSAAALLVEAEVTEFTRKPTGGGPVMTDDFPVLGVLTGGGSTAFATGFAGSAGKSVGTITDTGAILAAGGSRRGDPGDVTTAADKAALRLIRSANDLLAADRRVVDFVRAVAPVLDLVARDDRSPGAPTWGIFAFTLMPMTTTVIGNRFLDLDVAVDLGAQPNDIMRLRFTPPIQTTIRDNTMLRVFRTDRVFPPEFGDGGEGVDIGRHPIFLFSYSDVTLENNAVSQIRPDDMPDAAYMQMFRSNYPQGMSSFAAISVHGVMGPKLRGIGNSAVSLRHCILVDCEAARQTETDSMVQNHWIFRENSVLPVFPIDDGFPSPAIFLGPTGKESAGFNARLISGHNHPINRDFETE